MQPSKYALQATKSALTANFSETNPELYRKLLPFQDAAPSLVVLTEGWGGVPYCSYYTHMNEVFAANLNTSFIWAPIYVTNHDEARYLCFKNVTNDFHPPTAFAPNLKMIEFWNESKGLGAGVVHTAAGGAHMQHAVIKFKKAWCELLDTVK